MERQRNVCSEAELPKRPGRDRRGDLLSAGTRSLPSCSPSRHPDQACDSLSFFYCENPQKNVAQTRRAHSLSFRTTRESVSKHNDRHVASASLAVATPSLRMSSTILHETLVVRGADNIVHGTPKRNSSNIVSANLSVIGTHGCPRHTVSL